MSEEVKRCCKNVRSEGMGMGQWHQCIRKGSIKVDGKFYCRQHDPNAYKARRELSDRKYDARNQIELRRFQLAQSAGSLLDAIKIILPMAKGYAAEHPVGNNAGMIETAETAIAQAEGRK